MGRGRERRPNAFLQILLSVSKAVVAFKGHRAFPRAKTDHCCVVDLRDAAEKTCITAKGTVVTIVIQHKYITAKEIVILNLLAID